MQLPDGVSLALALLAKERQKETRERIGHGGADKIWQDEKGIPGDVGKPI